MVIDVGNGRFAWMTGLVGDPPWTSATVLPRPDGAVVELYPECIFSRSIASPDVPAV